MRDKDFMNSDSDRRDHANERVYLQLLESVLNGGDITQNRTGVGTRSIFGYQCRYDLRRGFPLLTTKKMPFKSILAELVGFIRGYTNVKQFQDLGTPVWDGNANSDYWLNNPANNLDGDLGRIYGAQWRTWTHRDETGYPLEYDQLKEAVTMIKTDPNSRRIIVSAWNVGELDEMCLPPCHMIQQYHVHGDYLDLQVYQRSADLFLGVPFNIASYGALLVLMAALTNKMPRYFIHSLGNAHIYENHFDQVGEQLGRDLYIPPKLSVLADDFSNIDDVQVNDFRLIEYEHNDTLPGEMAV